MEFSHSTFVFLFKGMYELDQIRLDYQSDGEQLP